MERHLALSGCRPWLPPPSHFLQFAVPQTHSSKRSKPAVLPIPPASLPHLRRYVAEGRPHLLRKRDLSEGRLLANERGLSVNHMERLVKGIADRAGIARANPHALRRSVATHLVQGGASLPAVQHLLGHESLDTTQRYVALGLAHLRLAVENLSLPE